MMNGNRFLLFNLLCLSLVSCQKEKETPNVIVFLADDMGYGDLACYGNPIIKTPNIDRFATEGVRMTDCHSAGTVSSPSRAGLLTGRNPYRSGFFYIHSRDTYLKEEEVTLAEVLKNSGYQTGFWGKWHLSTLEPQKSYRHPGPSEQGFDYWMGTTLNAFGGPKNVKKFIKNGQPMGEVEGWYCDVIVDDARQWLKTGRDKEKPFFLYISSHEPHTPVEPPREYEDRYRNAEVDALEKTISYGGVARPEKDITPNKSAYYGTVSQLDAAFGRLMATLKELDLEDNTIVIFTSDNGPEAPVTDEESLGEWDDPIRDYCFGSPGEFRGMKRYPYEGGHRVPGIIRYPGKIPAATTSDVLFNACDFLPTLCRLTGAPLPENRKIDGEEAFNAFLNRPVERENPVVWMYPNHEDTFFRLPQISVRQGNYTLIGWLPKKPEDLSLRDWIANYAPERFELYDLSVDKSQKNDIASSRPEVVEAMKPYLLKIWREMCDEGMGK